MYPKSKSTLSRFAAAFVTTMMAVALSFGFYYVTSSSAKYGYAGSIKLVSLKQTGELAYDLTVLGGKVRIDLASLNTAQKYRQQLFSLTPAPIRLVSQLITRYTTEQKAQAEQNRNAEFERYVAESLRS